MYSPSLIEIHRMKKGISNEEGITYEAGICNELVAD
jgi:hypothetical protein